MKILLTGGHLAPALATIQHIPKNAEIVYVGRKHTFEGDTGLSLEYQVISDMGIKFIPLDAGRLQRSVTPKSIKALLKAPGSLQKALTILRTEKPDVVVGFGGYLSLPVGIAASLLGIPLVIHEQTMHAGFANKILGKFAQKVAISWESSEKYFPKEKVVLVGNPHLETKPSVAMKKLMENTKDLPRLVITGGSGGSHAINVIVEHILPQLLEKYHVIHQTGDAKEFGDYNRLHALQKTFPKDIQEHYHLMKFIDPSDFDFLYQHASLVVSRSGINTVTSLLMLGIPSLLIPLPHGQKNEQLTNAQFLKNIGIAEIIPQSMHPENILLHIETMMQRRQEYLGKERKKYADIHQKAAESFVQLLYVTAQVNSQKKN